MAFIGFILGFPTEHQQAWGGFGIADEFGSDGTGFALLRILSIQV